ncbi:hypothetical protein ACROYT_G022043 [Oculina patagonica]
MGNGNTKAGTVRKVMQANKKFRAALQLWEDDRSDREPWKTILRNGPSAVYRKRKELIEFKDEELMEYFNNLLQGHIQADSRWSLPTREIAIFLSSTFTDMTIERDLLMEDVYPYLREFCRRLGYNFSVADMRWGVRDEMTDEHQAVEICVTEVQRCRKESVGPYMVCLIGDKYGYRPVPVKIDEEVFEMLLGSVKSNSGNKNASELLEKWYKLDENSVPAAYVLLPISTFFPHAYKHAVDVDDAKAKQERQQWWQTLVTMREALKKAASQIDFTAFPGCALTEDDFKISVTEEEITTGIKGEDMDPNYMFLFLRSLNGLEEVNPNNNGFVKRFVDVDERGRKSQATTGDDAKCLLDKLKDDCQGFIPKNNICRYSLDFHVTKDGHIDTKQNKEEIKTFCDKFCQLMVDSIQEAVAKHKVINDPLYLEVLHHATVAEKRTEAFVGRTHPLIKMEAYLKMENGEKPFIVHGISGCGKTSLMAKVFTTSLENWSGVDTGRPFQLIRFIGTSPSSTNVRSLLRSLCHQMCLVLNDSSTVITDNYERLVATFRSLLQRATPEKPFVLFLDSLDQLSDQDDGRALRWLPTSLPKNVHIILSTLPNTGGCLAVLKTKLKPENNADFYLEVSSLEFSDAENILDTRLENEKRKITEEQRLQVLETCSKPTALYMKLACDTALRWKSFSQDTHKELRPTATELIIQLFERLVTKHGEQFVRRALGYITASKTGLTKSELEDVLSCDDIVLADEVFKYHVPPIRRLPPLLWTRLRNDLGSYLVKVAADGHVVYKWYHRLFLEAARSYFLSDKPFTDSLHRDLANYFNGRWAREAKPYTDKQGNTRSAHRMVADQPLILSTDVDDKMDLGDEEAGPRYNLRKLSELPYHLIRSEMWYEFVEIVCQIPWLMAKCKAGKAFELTLELSEASLKCTKDKSAIIEDVYSCIRANAQQLRQFPELVPQLCLNEPYVSYCQTMAQKYLKTTSSSSGNKITLWRDLTKLESRKINVASFKHPTAVRKCVFSKGCKYLATYAADGVLRIFMVASGYTVMTKHCDCHVISFPASIDQCHWVAVAGTKSIVRYGLGSGGKHEGTILQEIKVDCDIDDRASLAITKKGKVWEIFLATSHGKLRSYSTSPSSHGQPVLKEELPRRPKVLTISPNGNSLAFGSDKVYLWSPKSQKDVKVFETGKKTNPQMDRATLRFSKNGAKLGAVLSNGTYIWNTQSAKLLRTLALNCLGVEFVVFSPEFDYIASQELKDKEHLQVLCMAPPYDKSPEWETLTGHSGEVRDCCIGNRESGHPLIASASDDNTVQLWDTRNMPSPKVVKLPNHNHSVQECTFSSDDRLAVSCSATETWVWQAQQPVHRLHRLHPASGTGASGTCPCFSEDSEFVSVFVETGVDVWHLKSGLDPHGSDRSLLMGAHRTLTLLTVRHLFTKFTSDGLYCCLHTESEPNTVRLYLAVNKYSLERWAHYALKDPPPSDLNDQEPFEQRFSVDEGNKVFSV